MALDTIDCTLSRILFHEPSRFSPTGVKFLIGKTTSGSIIKGELRHPREGERYRLWGNWAAQKGRDEPAFEFVSHEVLMDEGVAGITDYLRHHVPGLGLVKAGAIVEAFGADTLTILRTDADRALAVPGITSTIVASIRTHFDEDVILDPAAYARLVDLFSGHRFPRKVVKALLEDWGSDAPAKVVENPYLLLAYPRMGWKGVDAFALDLNGAAYAPDGLDRQVAAIVEGLERLAGDGHTYGMRIEVERITFELIGRRPEDLAWNVAVIDGLVARLDDRDDWWDRERADNAEEAYALPKYTHAERAIARHVARLMAGAGPLGFSLTSDRLSPEQQIATGVIRDNSVSILVGPPGTGKSYTLAAVIARLIVRRTVGTIRVVAPTGKAAKRAAELIDAAVPGHSIECSTIHRALGMGVSNDAEGASATQAKVNRGRDEFGFKHGEGEPLDVDFLVVDETSMVDVRLGASLLSALATGTRVVFVGDPDQLPSVGPGSVLRDLMAAGVPTASLSTIQRSDGGGRVVRACHAIRAGRVPEPAQRVGLPTENWVHVEEDDPGRIAQTIVELHESARKNGRYDPLWDMQVVSAQRGRLAFACDALNVALSRVLNPRGWGADEPGAEAADAFMNGFGPPFRVGDKIVRTKNGAVDEMHEMDDGDEDAHEDWRWRDVPYALDETAVVNGDMGQVLDIVTEPALGKSFAVVAFRTPDRLCRLPMGEPHLLLGYALTVHKMQGSGVPYVIMPVHNSFYWDQQSSTGLWSRELVYTGISRAEKLLVTVGQFSAIRMAIGRKTVHQRRTRLVERLGEALTPRVVGDPREVLS